jgi:hypothetical protein
MRLLYRRAAVAVSVLLLPLAVCAALHADSAPAGQLSDIQELQRGIADLRSRLAQLEAALAAAEAARKKTNETQAAKHKAVTLDGYMQVRYEDNDARAGANQFYIRRARLNIRAALDEHVSSRIELNMSGRDTGEGYGSKTMLREAYIDYAGGPQRLRMGQAKIPFGYEVRESGRELWSGQRALVLERLFPDESDLGAQYRWDWGPERPQFDIGVFNGTGINENDDNDRKDPVASVTLPFRSGSAALSYYNGRNGNGATDEQRNRLGGGLKIDSRQIAFVGEYVSGTNRGADVAGWYAQIGYRLPQSGLVFVKYDQYDENVALPGDFFKRTTIGWFRNYTPSIRLTVDYELRSVGDEFIDRARWDGNAGLVQWQVVF